MKTKQELDMIRGKMAGGVATVPEIHDFLEYVSEIEVLVIQADIENLYGPKGWRHFIGIAD